MSTSDKYNTFIVRLLFRVSFLVFMAGCTEKSPVALQTPSASIPLDSVTDHLPDAPGSDYFRANCMTCHSLRYIEMQPDLPRPVWEKVTGKMVKAFGAPIADSTMTHIVDYLVAVKGKK